MSLTLIEPVRVRVHHGQSGSWLDLHDQNGHCTTVHLPPAVADAWAAAWTDAIPARALPAEQATSPAATSSHAAGDFSDICAPV